MKKNFLIATTIAVLPCAVRAELRVSANDLYLGQSCWSGNEYLDYKLIKCIPSSDNFMPEMIFTCGGSYSETESDSCFVNNNEFASGGVGCILDVTGNAFYVCTSEADMNEGVICEEAINASWNALPDFERNYVSGGNNRVYFSYTECDMTNIGGNSSCSGNYKCGVSCDVKTEWGCNANYYHSGGTGDAYVCSPCPSSGKSSGLEDTGDITTCYIPSGTKFSDDTGSGVYSTNCYYKL